MAAIPRAFQRHQRVHFRVVSRRLARRNIKRQQGEALHAAFAAIFSDDVLKLNEGTVYASLMRLLHRRWISAAWGSSENNRKAKFYTITRAGRRQLTAATRDWERIAGVMARLLRSATQS